MIKGKSPKRFLKKRKVSQKEKSFPKRKKIISEKQNKKSKPASGIRERDRWIRLQASSINVYTWIQLVMESFVFTPSYPTFISM